MSKLRINSMVLGYVQTNCYFAWRDSDQAVKEAIVIDPADRGDIIFEKATEKGLKIVGIFITHGHYDHIMGVSELAKLTGAKVYAGKAEKELLEDALLNVSGEVGTPYTLAADVYLSDGEELALADLNIRVIATPGHTAGGVCYYLPADATLFSGDTLFREAVGRTDLPTGNMRDLVTSIKTKLFVLPEETIVYPGHDATSDIAFEKQCNPFVQ